MSNLREAAEAALEALEGIHRVGEYPRLQPAVTALRAALAEQEQEPVAWMDRDGDVYPMPENKNWAPPHTMLYTASPQRKPLTDVEIWEALSGIDCTRPLLIARAIEAHHGIKEEA